MQRPKTTILSVAWLYLVLVVGHAVARSPHIVTLLLPLLLLPHPPAPVLPGPVVDALARDSYMFFRTSTSSSSSAGKTVAGAPA